MVKTGIYKITNPKNKVYIGQSTNIDKRIVIYSQLQCKDQPLLFNSFKKYGFDKHIFEILALCPICELNSLERYYIDKYQSNDKTKGLNLTNGGQDYFKHNEEVRAKMSAAQMGNQKTLGRIQTKEEIQKRVLKTTGLKRTKEQRERISNGLKGRKLTEQHKKNISNGLKGILAKKILNTETGVIYKSCQEAADAFGLKKSLDMLD